MLNKIFINYRREDSNWPTQMIYNKLNERYDNLVFKDMNISGGENFENRIKKEIHNCKIFIAILNVHWLKILKNNSAREIDYVILEIETALVQGKRIIPVLIDDTQMPSKNDFPEKIKALQIQNVVRISLINFDNDIDKLCNEINKGLRNEEPIKKALILDESSVRGFVTLGLLQQLENILNENKTQPKGLASYFDFIVSSGPSSFIAAMLAMGLNIDKIFGLYRLYIEAMFLEKSSLLNRLISTYKIDKAQQVLNDVFSTTSIQDKIFKTKFGIFTYNIDLGKTSVFTNFDIPSLQPNKKELLISNVILGSSSFPTYHAPHMIKTEDNSCRHIAGSVGLSQDPTLGTALFIKSENETIKWNMNSDQLFFLSVGRGQQNDSLEVIDDISLLNWASILPTSILKNYTKSNNSILSLLAQKNTLNKFKNVALEDALLSNLSIDTFLLTLSRIDVNLDKEGIKPQKTFEDNPKNIDFLFDFALNNKNSIAEFNSIKRYFE